MNRALVLIGALASAGLAVFTAESEANWIAPPGGNHHQLGRSEWRVQRGATAVAPGGGVVDCFDPNNPFGGADNIGGTVPTPANSGPDEGKGPPQMNGDASTAAAGGPENPSTTAPEEDKPVPKQRDLIEVRDFEMCMVTQAWDDNFGRHIRVHLDEEGVIWWMGTDKKTEIPSSAILRRNLDANFGSALIIVPHHWTNWQEVQEAIAAAGKSDVEDCFIGVATKVAPTVLKTIRVKPATADFPAPDAPFQIQVKGVDESGGAPIVTINEVKAGKDYATDIAIAWSTYRREQGAVDTSTVAATPVILDIHRFTPMHQAAQVLVVLREIGIQAERYTGAIWKRKRR